MDNTKNNIPSDFKEVTGWDTPQERYAYEKGRADEQTVILKFIENWDGHTKSTFGRLMYEKFMQLKDKL